jgi:hypothetical protein
MRLKMSELLVLKSSLQKTEHLSEEEEECEELTGTETDHKVCGGFVSAGELSRAHDLTTC